MLCPPGPLQEIEYVVCCVGVTCAENVPANAFGPFQSLAAGEADAAQLVASGEDDQVSVTGPLPCEYVRGGVLLSSELVRRTVGGGLRTVTAYVFQPELLPFESCASALKFCDPAVFHVCDVEPEVPLATYPSAGTHSSTVPSLFQSMP